jgi:hypothetical protein
MKEDISNAFLDFITCTSSHRKDVSAALKRPSQFSIESFGIQRVFRRRSSSSFRPPSPQQEHNKNNDDIGDDVDEVSCKDDVGVAGSVNEAEQTEMANTPPLLPWNTWNMDKYEIGKEMMTSFRISHYHQKTLHE